MGTAISRVSCLQNAEVVQNKQIKVRLLHRPTSLSNTHDEMTQAVRLLDKVEIKTPQNIVKPLVVRRISL